MLVGHGPYEQMGNSKGHGSRNRYIEFRFSKDSDHEAMKKGGEGITGSLNEK